MTPTKHLPTALFACLIFTVGCAPTRPPDPLTAARDKMAAARSVQFRTTSTWNNTFVQDTTTMPTQTGTYLRHDRGGFPYDFVFQTEGFASLYRNHRLRGLRADALDPGTAELHAE